MGGKTPEQLAAVADNRDEWQARLIEAAHRFDRAGRGSGTWTRVPDDQVMRLITGALSEVQRIIGRQDELVSLLAAAEHEAATLREANASLTAENELLKAVLRRLADEDEWVLNRDETAYRAGNELHVRASLAAQALGAGRCDCPNCAASLPEPDPATAASRTRRPR